MISLTTIRMGSWIFIILELAVLITAAIPRSMLNNQDAAEYQLLQMDPSAYYKHQFPNYEDSVFIDKLQRIMKKSEPTFWDDDDYKFPEIKRQVRYRQCYFNPISCFRK